MGLLSVHRSRGVGDTRNRGGYTGRIIQRQAIPKEAQGVVGTHFSSGRDVGPASARRGYPGPVGQPMGHFEAQDF